MDGGARKGSKMNAKMAMVWMLVAGLWVAGARGQEDFPSNMDRGAKGIDPTEGYPFVLSGLDWNSNGNVTLRFTALAGMGYEIEGTTSIGDDWIHVDSWMSDTNGEAEVTVEPYGARFFRIAFAGEGGEVLSANALGYTTCVIPAGGKQMVSFPFANPASDDGGFRFGETQMARDLPVGSVVYFWDGERQSWNGGMKSAFGWDPAEGNHVLQPGEGICVLNPTDADVEVVVAGEVPSDSSLIRPYAGDNKWCVMANPYPVDAKFGDTKLASQLRRSSMVRFWEPESQRWFYGTKNSKGWPAALANRTLECGEAFFIQTDDEGIWETMKPYIWP